jgi:hypothetical protein
VNATAAAQIRPQYRQWKGDMGIRRVFAVALLVVAVFALVPAAQAAGPKSFGVMDPTDSCPWPDEIDPLMQQWGVEKCLPGSIKWTGGEGIRIVTDQLLSSGSETGSVTFWCETTNGLRYKLNVSGLAPNTSYPIRLSGYRVDFATGALSTFESRTIGYVHTDANGSGVVGGSVQLASGGYELDFGVGSLHSDPEDLQGIAVFK